MEDALIEFSNVSLTRGTTRILDRVNLSILRRESVAIVGPNGSGKSSLLKLLMRIFYPSVEPSGTGSVRILGQTEWNVWELRRNLGFVSAEIDQHFTHGRSARLTAADVIITGFFSSELEPDFDRVTPQMRSTAEHWLCAFQMEAYRNKPIGHMSTGERRRVLLARSLVFDPGTLILDEPTSGLDIVARARLLREIQSLANQGKQFVLVTHHFEELLPCFHRVILMKAGKVFYDGPRSVAITSEMVSKQYDTKLQIDHDATGIPFATLL